MVSLVIQTLLLITIAFILGAVLGCLLRKLFGSEQSESDSNLASSGTEKAVSMETAVSDPVVPKPPVPPTPITPVEKPTVQKAPDAPKVTPKASKPAQKATAKKTTKPKTKTKQPAVASSSQPDNLKLIRGIGPQNETRLNDIGINSFEQIANWSSEDEAHYGDILAFPGRIEREEWVSQATILAKGGSTDFAKRVKTGDVLSSTGDPISSDLGTKPVRLLSSAKNNKADNLSLIDGVGNAIEKKMAKLGIFHFDQIAEMSKDELTWLGHAIGFPGRPERENWAGEAATLAKGEVPAPTEKAKRGVIKSKK